VKSCVGSGIATGILEAKYAQEEGKREEGEKGKGGVDQGEYDDMCFMNGIFFLTVNSFPARLSSPGACFSFAYPRSLYIRPL